MCVEVFVEEQWIMLHRFLCEKCEYLCSCESVLLSTAFSMGIFVGIYGVYVYMEYIGCQCVKPCGCLFMVYILHMYVSEMCCEM